MTRIDTLKSLQARIREATGADRRLDEDVFLAFLPQDKWRVDMNGRLPALTSDPDGLGACVALMREVLPGWPGSVSWNRNDGRGSCFASAQVPDGYDGPAPWPEGWGHNNNACLALLDAICAALIAEEEAKLTDASQNTDTRGK